MNTFPFTDNTSIQRKEEFESSFKVKSYWGKDLDTLLLAVDIYKLRCNLNLKSHGNSTYRSINCECVSCPFTLKANVSATGCHITKFVAHTCNPNLDILAKPMKIKNIKKLINIPTNINAETMSAKEVKAVLQDQMLLHPDVDPCYQNLISFRIERQLKVSYKYKNIKGIEEFGERFCQLDPDNQFHLDIRDGVYHRSQFIIGAVKRLLLARKNLKSLDVDGSHLKSNCGILLGICISDANNEFHVLSISHESKEESIDQWDQFYFILQQNIPNMFDKMFHYMSDRDSGIQSLVKSLETTTEFHDAIESSFSICTLHLKRNIYFSFKANTIKKRAYLNQLVDPIIYANSIEEFKIKMDELKEINSKLHNYINQIPPEKYARCYSSRGNSLTSNSIEAVWAWLLPIRKLNSITMIYYEIYIKQLKKLEDELNRAQLHKGVATPYADNIVINNLKIERANFNGYLLFGKNGVKTKNGIRIIDMKKRSCSCRSPNVAEFPCSHLLFAFYKRNALENIEAMIDEKFLSSSWCESLKEAMPINHPDFGINDLKVDNTFGDPIYSSKRGRPRKIKPPRKLPAKSRSSKNSYPNKINNAIKTHGIEKKRRCRINYNKKRLKSKGEL